jgi:holo-[acyl-carrier protein] synthase
MILGTGIDIVDLPRFKLIANDQKFLITYFSKSEIILKIESLAGRFAAKEAFFKALTDKEIFNWEDIEVIKQSNGAPRFNFRNKLAEFALDKNIHLSISHSGDSVIAFVIIEN